MRRSLADASGAVVIKHVVWDWNGTLLDDVSSCVDTINTLLRERAMPELDHGRYRGCFGFPVRHFYEGLGFDFAREDFAAVSTTFIQRYEQQQAQQRLHHGALDTLTQLSQRGVTQHVVSAMEARMLERMLTDHAIAHHMQSVRGLGHLHATSKVDLGVALIAELQCDPQQVLFVGDTLHDHETAVAMGCQCALFTGGHQTHARLQDAGVALIDNLPDILALLDRS